MQFQLVRTTGKSLAASSIGLLKQILPGPMLSHRSRPIPQTPTFDDLNYGYSASFVDNFRK